MPLWRNSQTNFGLLTKLLHWGMAVLIFGLIALGMYLTNVKISISQLYLFNWHKAAGILALSLISARILWHLWSRLPHPLAAPLWQTRLARAVHVSLYVLLLAIPLSGWIASSASGFEMSLFGLFSIPFIAPTNAKIEDLFFEIHDICTSLLLVFLFLHIGGAMHRQFFKHDKTLRRMWF
jgi:cytochrome b561